MSTPDWREAHDAGRDSGYAAGRAEAGAELTSLRARVADLSMLVRRLSRYAPPGLAGDALDYLKRHGLEGSPMRDAGNKEGSRDA